MKIHVSIIKKLSDRLNDAMDHVIPVDAEWHVSEARDLVDKLLLETPRDEDDNQG